MVLRCRHASRDNDRSSAKSRQRGAARSASHASVCFCINTTYVRRDDVGLEQIAPFEACAIRGHAWPDDPATAALNTEPSRADVIAWANCAQATSAGRRCRAVLSAAAVLGVSSCALASMRGSTHTGQLARVLLHLTNSIGIACSALPARWCPYVRPGNPRPRSSVHVTCLGPISPVTARPRSGSRAGLHGASVKVSSRRITAILPVGVTTWRS